MSSEAARKAWATRRARMTGASHPEPDQLPPARRKRVLVDRVSPLAVAKASPELTAGQKAAASRKALEDARAEREAMRNGIEAPSPLASSKMVTLWVEHDKIGDGYRNFLVVEIGQKQVVLFNAPTLCEITIDRVTFERHAKPYRSLTKTVAAIIARNQGIFERFNLDYDARASKRAAAALAA